MTAVDDISISPEDSIETAAKVIQQHDQKIALVVSRDGRLLGTVTDGDIRRAVLRRESMDVPVEKIMNSDPKVVREQDGRTTLLALMQRLVVRHLPRVDKEGRLVGLFTIDDLIAPQVLDNWVVIMAGGRGLRLRPLTDDTPKPMLKVGAKPMLEHLLERLRGQGFWRFFLSVNYKSEVIESHFGDGTKHGVEIQYLRENKALGTAGSLSLLPETPTLPVLVVNGDVMTKVDLGDLVRFHGSVGSIATMGVREYRLQLPYGVVETTDHQIIRMCEKPKQRHLINAGIYLIDPAALALIPKDEHYDMPDLFQKLLSEEQPTSAFHISEDWIDIGQLDDLRRAEHYLRWLSETDD